MGQKNSNSKMKFKKKTILFKLHILYVFLASFRRQFHLGPALCICLQAQNLEAWQKV